MRIGVDREVLPDGVAVLTLSGRTDGNPYTASMGRELGQAYREYDEDDAIRVIVVTGRMPGFCVGADLAGGGDTFEKTARGFTASPVQPPAFDLRKPVIAAVNGHAIGIGMTIALQADLRVLATESRYGIVQVRRGVLPDACAHWTLPAIVGPAAAADLLLTGRKIDGPEALRLGLANELCPAAEVLGRALEIATDMAVNTAPLSVAATKAILVGSRRHGWSPEEVAARETAAHRSLMGAPDAREGVVAYLERRRPRWQGSVAQGWPGVDPEGFTEESP